MNRIRASSVVMAVLGAALWLLWNFEHAHTGIRAPWTGLILAASALAFMATGVVGRGSRAVAVAIAAAAAAVVLVDLLVWPSDRLEPGVEESCDPGCISRQAAGVLGCAAAAARAAGGILLRRALGGASRV